jgi:MFS family permease
MSRAGAVEAIVPARLGSRFRWLLASSWVSNAAEGVAFAAGPLLVASQTNRPFLVALASVVQQLPWMLFGLHAGVVADRFDRRRLVIFANLVRVAVLGVLVAFIAFDAIDITVVLVVLFLMGTAETLSDTTASTLLPMLVEHDDLGVANARLRFGQITLNRLVVPPLGAVMFAAGMAIPFAAQALLLALAAILVVRIGVTPPVERPEPTTAGRDIVEGLQWVWRHHALRTLVVTILAFNITFGATFAILVLYARDRLGLGALGFGLFETFAAAGGIIGAFAYGTLERRLGASGIMRIGLIIETLTHLVLAITTVPAVAFATLFVFGIHESLWGTTASTVRQKAVPNELQGRVAAVYNVAVLGSMVIGAMIGGVIAGVWGITAPFWFGFVGSAVILVCMWQTFSQLDEVGPRPPSDVVVA